MKGKSQSSFAAKSNNEDAFYFLISRCICPLVTNDIGADFAPSSDGFPDEWGLN
jgi:hypothetical protein